MLGNCPLDHEGMLVELSEVRCPVDGHRFVMKFLESLTIMTITSIITIMTIITIMQLGGD